MYRSELWPESSIDYCTPRFSAAFRRRVCRSTCEWSLICWSSGERAFASLAIAFNAASSFCRASRRSDRDGSDDEQGKSVKAREDEVRIGQHVCILGKPLLKVNSSSRARFRRRVLPQKGPSSSARRPKLEAEAKAAVW